jgi:hypothetical protein
MSMVLEATGGGPEEPAIFVLGFDYEAVVGAWQDVRLADAIDRLWRRAGCPETLRAWWAASADEYAFRWYVNEELARVLDEAKITWRPFVIGRIASVPEDARPFMEERPSAP